MAEQLVCPPPAATHGPHCGDCAMQYLTTDVQRSGKAVYTEELTDEEAKLKIDALLEAINTLRGTLSNQLETHGDLILTRWTKKSSNKRAAILKSTTLMEPMNSIVVEQHPLDTWIKTNGAVWVGARWMSIEPFAEDRNRLLALLHVRTAYTPASFALLDTRESTVAFVSTEQSQLSFNAKCVKMFGDDYGSLCDYDAKKTHSWACIGFPRAHLTLHSQLGIMMFLMDVVQDIVQDETGTGNEKWRALVEGGFREKEHEALRSPYTNPVFAPPAITGFDPKIMLQKAQVRLNVVVDDIWCMQTDPRYMRAVLQDRRASIVYDGAAPSTDAKWDHLAIDFLNDILNRLAHWYIIVLTCTKVDSLFEQHVEQIALGKPLPDEVNAMMNVLGSELHNRLRAHSMAFDKLIPSLGPMRSRYIASERDGVLHQREVQRMDPSHNADRLIYLIGTIQDDIATGPKPHGLSMQFDLLERELLAQGTVSQVDPRMRDQLNDIMTLDDMWQMYIWNQMCHDTYDDALAQMTQQQREARLMAKSRREGARLGEGTVGRIARQMRLFYEAPQPKGKKDLAWLDTQTEAKRRLANFWQVVREEMEAAQIASGMDMSRSALKTIQFDTEPEHIAELDRERQECQLGSQRAGAVAAAAARELVESAARQAQTTLSASSDEGGLVKRKQTKARLARMQAAENSTEGTAAVQSNPVEVAAQSSDAPASKELIVVKHNSISVFHKMYPLTGSDPGSVRWMELVRALVDAGLTATESGGSAVNFSDSHATVQLHRPHPDDMVHPIMLKNTGRRLNKYFWWSREMFRQTTKGEEV